ncbi:MAG: hypothetical protein AB9919_12335 [Geobacteraceae bacterium]
MTTINSVRSILDSAEFSDYIKAAVEGKKNSPKRYYNNLLKQYEDYCNGDTSRKYDQFSIVSQLRDLKKNEIKIKYLFEVINLFMTSNVDVNINISDIIDDVYGLIYNCSDSGRTYDLLFSINDYFLPSYTESYYNNLKLYAKNDSGDLSYERLADGNSFNKHNNIELLKVESDLIYNMGIYNYIKRITFEYVLYNFNKLLPLVRFTKKVAPELLIKEIDSVLIEYSLGSTLHALGDAISIYDFNSLLGIREKSFKLKLYKISSDLM